MAKLNIFRIRAFTILETFIALTITLFMFGMMTTLFMQISRQSYSSRKIRAHEMLNGFILFVSQNDSYSRSELIKDEYVLKCRFTKVDSLPFLFRSEFEILDKSGKVLDQAERYVYSQNIENYNQ
jgi:hypothetical protein